MDFLSPSQIITYNTCPYKYYCKYTHRPTIKVSEVAKDFGTGVHDIILAYYKKINEDTPIDMALEKMEEAFAEGNLKTGESKKAKLKRVQSNFKVWETERIKKNRRLPTFTERTLKAEIFDGLPPMEGIIDAYYGDTALWVDWKTGDYEEMDFDRMVQGKCYEMLLTANDYPVEGGFFVNLSKGIRNPLPKIADSWLEKKIRTMVERIERFDFSPKKNHYCDGWCEYRLSCDLKNACPWGI